MGKRTHYIRGAGGVERSRMAERSPDSYREIIAVSFPIIAAMAGRTINPRPPPIPLEMICEPDVDYIPWQDDVPEIEVG